MPYYRVPIQHHLIEINFLHFLPSSPLTCMIECVSWEWDCEREERDGEKQSAQSSVLRSRRKLIRDWWIDSPPSYYLLLKHPPSYFKTHRFIAPYYLPLLVYMILFSVPQDCRLPISEPVLWLPGDAHHPRQLCVPRHDRAYQRGWVCAHSITSHHGQVVRSHTWILSWAVSASTLLILIKYLSKVQFWFFGCVGAAFQLVQGDGI